MEQKEYISNLSPHLFWDIDISKADMDTCPAQIIQRVFRIWHFKRLAFNMFLLRIR